MPINLKPPWMLYPPLLRGIFMLAFIIFAGMAATMEAHAEELDAWYKSFSCELDDTGRLITLTGVNEGVEDVVIKGSASIDGKEYHTLVDSDLFQSSDKEAIKSIVFESGVSFPSWIRRMFYDLKNLESITFAPGIDTHEVSDMVNLFNGCRKLKAVDLSSFKVPKVHDLDGIFAYCESLESVNLNGFEPGEIDGMYGTFRGCTSLETLDLTTLHTGSCKSFYCTFYKCTALKTLDLSRFETGSALSLASIFEQCSALERLDLSSFDTSGVSSFSGMFSGCTSLKNLDLSGFDTTKGENFEQMFYRCSTLEQLDLSGFSTANATNLSSMFYGCSALKELDISGFSTAKATQMSSMFRDCSSLVSLDLSVFDLSALESCYSIMNSGMDSLREIRTPKAIGAVSVPLPAFFAEMDAEGRTRTDSLYALLEEAPAQTAIYRVPAYSVIFYGDVAGTESKKQYIARDADTPLELNTFMNEGKAFLGWGTYSSDATVSYADGEVVRNLAADRGTVSLYAVWGRPRGFTFVIPARASFTMLSESTFGAEIPYSIIYTGRNADCVRVSSDAGTLRDAFGNELSLNCWNTRPTWFVMAGGGGTLNEATGCYEGTGVITVSVNSGYLTGTLPGLYTGTLTVTVGFL